MPKTRTRKGRGRFAPVFAALLLCLAVRANADHLAPRTPFRILVIHSYHPSFEWTRSIHQNLVDTLDEWAGNFSLSVEYMDTKRIFTPGHIEGLVTLYEAKYANSPPDLVISSDNNAFEMLYNNRERIFGSAVPVIFCGVNYFAKDDWPGMKNYIGIDERPDLTATVSLIDKIHDKPSVIAFINDTSTSGKAYLNGYRDFLSDRNDTDRFIMVEEGFPDDILTAVAELPDDTAILYHTYARDPAGNVQEPEALLRRLDEKTPFPIYGNYTWMFGEGIVGGPLIDGALQGILAAKMAIGVMEGHVDPDVFQLVPSPSTLHFDYREVRENRIPLDRIPPQGIMDYSPETIWKRYPQETALVGIIIVLLVVGLVISSRLSARYRQTVIMHRLNERRLQTLDRLVHLDDKDEGRLVRAAMKEMLKITDSRIAVVQIQAEGEASFTYFSEIGPSGQVNDAEINDSPLARWVGESIANTNVLSFEEAVPPLNTGRSMTSLSRGIITACGLPNSDEGTSLIAGVFNKETRYSEGDRRQLSLLADGVWKIFTRNRIEKSMREMNIDLENRVTERSEELRRTEQELLRAEKLASLGSLVAGIAHEVNTPLGLAVTASSFLVEKLENFGDLVDEGTLSEESARELIELGRDLGRSMKTNLQKAAQLIRSFRQVAVDQTGENPRQFHMAELLEENTVSIKNELKKVGANLVIECPEYLVLNHYPGDIWSVITNLVMNSIKHGFSEKTDGKINIAVQDADDDVEIIYADNGSGIPDEIIDRIFDPFFTTARGSGGTGLGLHIVRSIITDKHGGVIHADSRDSGGVVFTISFPKVSPVIKGTR